MVQHQVLLIKSSECAVSKFLDFQSLLTVVGCLMSLVPNFRGTVRYNISTAQGGGGSFQR